MKSIAVDGPAGVGKDTVCGLVSKALGILHINSGGLYRAFGHVYDTHYGHEESLIPTILQDVQLRMEHSLDGPKYFFSQENITDRLGTSEAGALASEVSRVPEVRRWVNEKVHEFAQKHPVIVDGRDATTNILPDAPLRIYLDAPSEVRAERRRIQLEERGFSPSFEEVLRAVKERDNIDMNKGEFSLRKAKGVRVIDTTDRPAEDIAEEIVTLYHELA